MRKRFPALVERGRVTGGVGLSSAPGDDFGMFLLRKPPIGRRIKIIASNGDAESGIEWDHVSVSLEDRCPTWDEMVWVKRLFFESTECAVEYHPPYGPGYVNVHPHCLHLWRPHNIEIPMPPLVCV